MTDENPDLKLLLWINIAVTCLGAYAILTDFSFMPKFAWQAVFLAFGIIATFAAVTSQ